jgi:hypothetical protein
MQAMTCHVVIKPGAVMARGKGPDMEKDGAANMMQRTE